MALKHVQKTYDELGRKDPLYAVLSFPETIGNQWDPEEFFARGSREIKAAMEKLAELDLRPATGRALDFGCGVGRLTQGLCEHFDQAVGVDISASMIDHAFEFNRHGEKCTYLVNTRDDLSLLGSDQFDFVYSNITLQHIPPEASRQYIAEFFRILRPGGVALFQVPSGPRHDPGTSGARWYAFKRGPLRRFWKRLRRKPPVEIHYMASSQVKEIIHDSGASFVDAWEEGARRGQRVRMWYLVRK